MPFICLGTGQQAGILAGALMLALATTGCTSSGNSADDTPGAAACANRVEFKSRTYTETGGRQVSLGERLGSAELLSCTDSAATQEPDLGMLDIYRIRGVDESFAVAVGADTQDAEIYTAEGVDLPRRVADLLE
ncbi:hypothetical protein GCM10027062_05220 [Nocardioides hungaricus]